MKYVDVPERKLKPEAAGAETGGLDVAAYWSDKL